MRAVGLHADVVVAISRAYQTTCTLVRSGNEAFCVDSPVFPDELEILPAIAEQAGFPVVGVLATHADWDHLLGRYAFPEAPLGCAETTAARLIDQPGRGAARAARVRRGALRRAPVAAVAAGRPDAARAGPLRDRRAASSSCTPPTATPRTAWRSGSRGRGCSSRATTSRRSRSRWSPRPARLRAYLATLDRLEPLVEQADHVVPGPRRADRRHARRGDPARGPRLPARRCASSGAEAKLPLARRSGAQRKIHAENARRWRRERRRAGRARCTAHAGAARARRGDPRRRARAARRRPAGARRHGAAGRGGRAAGASITAGGARPRGGAARASATCCCR